MAVRIIRLPEVKTKTGQSRSTIYDRIKEGTFPAPIQLGSGRSVGWIEQEVDDWIAACIEKSRPAKGK